MSVLTPSNKWFVCPRRKPAAETRLFLFPYAGGGPAVFRQWATSFSDHIEVWIAHYPGRGSRMSEPLIKDVVTLAEKFSPAIRPLLDKSFAFFGHSLGGLVAFELARQLQKQNFPPPQILFASACGAPHLPDPHPPIHKYPDAEFIRSVVEFNGIASEVIDQLELMQLLLPMLRADFEAVENYQYNSAGPPLPIPIVALAGLDDPRVSRERVEDWALHTESGFESHYFPGDHFFINTCAEAVEALIAARLTSSYEKN